MKERPTYEELLSANKALQSFVNELSVANESLHTVNKNLHTTNSKLKETLADKEYDIQSLKLQIAELREKLYGKSSEKLSKEEVEQCSFLLEELEEKLETAVEQQVSSHTRGKKKSKPLSSNLLVERVEYEPEEVICSCCGEEKAKIGEETTEVLEHIPASYKITQHVKIKRACSKCKSGAVTAKLPVATLPFSGARIGYGLLATIIVNKYVDHLPLHRQEQIFLRQGIELPRQRLCDWIGLAAERYLMPLSQALRREILKSKYVKADETRIKVQDLDSTGWLWGIQSEEGDVYFEYNESRGGSVASSLFSISEAESYCGIVQTDLYAGYNKVFLPEATVRAGCWAHARRKFIEAEKSHKKECGVVLQLISKLYKVEKSLVGKSLDEISAKRAKQSKPLIEKLENYLRVQVEYLLPKSPFVLAARYSLKQWCELSLFLTEPRVKLDNNDIERQMRPIAVGRHNWLFAGSERGANWAACMFSILGTCKMHKVNPHQYLVDVMKRIQTLPEGEVHTLLPRAWKNAQGM